MSLEWESAKATILDLYINEDKPLPEVMNAMKAQGFNKTLVILGSFRASTNIPTAKHSTKGSSRNGRLLKTRLRLSGDI
jgi:hypothetical protein